jgi:hypothetical protein
MTAGNAASREEKRAKIACWRIPLRVLTIRIILPEITSPRGFGKISFGGDFRRDACLNLESFMGK